MHAEDDERRRARRFPVSGARVAFACPAPVTADVVDVGAAGVLVNVPRTRIDDWPALRSRISRARLEFADGVSVECTLQVAWLGGRVVAGARQYHSGLAFVDLAGEPAATLRAELARLEAASGASSP